MDDIRAEDMPAVMGDWARRLEGESLEESLRECVEIVQDGFEDNFGRQVDSHGVPWPPRKDSKPHPLLNETGALIGATQEGGLGNITIIADRHFTTGIDKQADAGGIRGAAVHNFGHDFGDFTVPQREYLYATEAVLESCGEVIADAATGWFLY